MYHNVAPFDKDGDAFDPGVGGGVLGVGAGVAGVGAGAAGVGAGVGGDNPKGVHGGTV